ncbi:hypothetical protein ACLOJK_007025 [Asimina triloba]
MSDRLAWWVVIVAATVVRGGAKAELAQEEASTLLSKVDAIPAHSEHRRRHFQESVEGRTSFSMLRKDGLSFLALRVTAPDDDALVRQGSFMCLKR